MYIWKLLMIGEYSQIKQVIYIMCIAHTIRLDTMGHLRLTK